MAFTCTNCKGTIGNPGYCVICGASNKAEELQTFHSEQWDIAGKLIDVLTDPQLHNRVNAPIMQDFMEYLSKYIQAEIKISQM